MLFIMRDHASVLFANDAENTSRGKQVALRYLGILKTGEVRIRIVCHDIFKVLYESPTHIWSVLKTKIKVEESRFRIIYL